MFPFYYNSYTWELKDNKMSETPQGISSAKPSQLEVEGVSVTPQGISSAKPSQLEVEGVKYSLRVYARVTRVIQRSGDEARVAPNSNQAQVTAESDL